MCVRRITLCSLRSQSNELWHSTLHFSVKLNCPIFLKAPVSHFICVIVIGFKFFVTWTKLSKPSCLVMSLQIPTPRCSVNIACLPSPSCSVSTIPGPSYPVINLSMPIPSCPVILFQDPVCLVINTCVSGSSFPVTSIPSSFFSQRSTYVSRVHLVQSLWSQVHLAQWPTYVYWVHIA